MVIRRCRGGLARLLPWGGLGAALCTVLALEAAGTAPAVQQDQGDPLFATSDRCIACHQGVTTTEGVGVSIGHDWRASMMANSARDPYWKAAVRREIMDYPEAAAEIETQCARCHMPMASVAAEEGEGIVAVFANGRSPTVSDESAALAADGVSCTVCHRISDAGLGTPESFSGGFLIDRSSPPGGPPVFGPFEPDAGGAGIMHSATGFQPKESSHIQSSELCASCHTLFTHAVRPGGEQGPEFPEQVPYLEWQASSFAGRQSCQDCHMPEVDEEVPVTRVLGRPRPNVSRHVFRGGNFFMLRMLERYGAELQVAALPAELALAAQRTEEHLRSATASVAVSNPARQDDRLSFDVEVRNRAGHKFPTGYPSRRAWLHVTVTAADGRSVFESGAIGTDGRVSGDDHDEDGSAYEPHYAEITSPDQVQVYQSVMLDRAGRVTTGLASAESWAKDNRLLPEGFDAAIAGDRAAVRGTARSDDDFGPGGDVVRYSIAVDPSAGPFAVTARLRFQPVGYRWAENLAAYDAFETRRFVRYYREMAGASAITVAEATAIAN